MLISNYFIYLDNQSLKNIKRADRWTHVFFQDKWTSSSITVSSWNYLSAVLIKVFFRP